MKPIEIIKGIILLVIVAMGVFLYRLIQEDMKIRDSYKEYHREETTRVIFNRQEDDSLNREKALIKKREAIQKDITEELTKNETDDYTTILATDNPNRVQSKGEGGNQTTTIQRLSPQTHSTKSECEDIQELPSYIKRAGWKLYRQEDCN